MGTGNDNGVSEQEYLPGRISFRRKTFPAGLAAAAFLQRSEREVPHCNHSQVSSSEEQAGH